MNANFYNDWALVTPSDTVDGPFPQIGPNPALFEGLFIGTSAAGNTIAVVKQNGEAVTFTNPPQGGILPVKGRRVNSTNTTASNIVALRQV
jgi:hypothetical protein